MISVPLTINGSPLLLDQTRPLPEWFYDSGSQVDGDGAITVHDPDYALDLTDPDYQNATSYQPSLDPDIDPWTVLPLQMFVGVKPMVMGCQAYLYNRTTKLWAPAVVGDRGPSIKVGENSIILNKMLGIPDSPISGGTDPAQHVIWYHILPGVPAVVTLPDGTTKTYTLQRFRS